MKRYITWLLSILLLLLSASAVSCVGPLKGWLNVTNKEQKTEQKVDKNKEETVDKTRSFIHGTGTALNLDPEPNKFNKVASDLNQRAELTLGPPSYQDALVIDKIVQGLLSTNEQIKVEAHKALDKKDIEIVGLQKDLDGLQGKLDKIQKEKDELGLVNSRLADTWKKITNWFWIIVWVIISGVILAVVSQVLAICLPPPYNGIFSIVAFVVGGIGRMILKLFPNAKLAAGVVDRTAHEISEKTLHTLVDALETIRHKEIKQEDIAPQVKSIKIKELIDSTLLAATDKNVREKILEVKKAMGLI